MKRLIFVLLILSAAAWGAACPIGYSFYGYYNIPAASSLTTDESNFVYPWLGDSHLATVANGGKSQSTGLDIVFCDALIGGNLLPYYLVPNTYSATTGAAEWLVYISTVSHTIGSPNIYVFVGKASDTDHSCGPSGSNNCSSTLCQGSYLGIYPGGTSSVGAAGSSDMANACANTTSSAVGTINTAAGIVVGSLDNTTAGSYVDTGSIQTSTAYTVTGWFNKSAYTGIGIGAVGNGSAHAGFGMYFESNRIAAYIANASGSSVCWTTGVPLTAGWHHMAAHYTGGAGNSVNSYDVYLDGTHIIAKTMASSGTGAGVMAAPTSNMFLGWFSAMPNKLAGLFDEIRLYSVVIDDDRVKADYLSTNSPSTFYSAFTFGGAAPSVGSANPCVFLICTR